MSIMYDIAGCKHCTDFQGCEDGYTLVEDDTCGQDSTFSNPSIKVRYCQADTPSPTPAPVPTTSPVINECPVSNDKQCDTDPCDCTSDGICDNCQNWGCVACADGYYKQSFDTF